MTRTGVNLVLLAEDQPVVRNLIYQILKSEGLEVIQASDGLDALQAARKAPGINILFTDLRMPRMDGATLCKELRRQLPGLKVIVFTGSPEDLALLERGCQPDLVLEKPLSARLIVEKIRELLGSHATVVEGRP